MPVYIIQPHQDTTEPPKKPAGGIATRFNRASFKSRPGPRDTPDEVDQQSFAYPLSYTTLPYLEGYKAPPGNWMSRKNSYLSQKFMNQLHNRKKSSMLSPGFQNKAYEIDNYEHANGMVPRDSLVLDDLRPSGYEGVVVDSRRQSGYQGSKADGSECPKCKERKDQEAEDDAPVTLADNFLGFTQYTSLHGVHFICEMGTFCFRRVLWFFLFFGCLSFLLYQIADRVVYLASSPVMVKVDITFNKTLRFPSVALCNQNSFRITKAADKNMIELLREVYTPSDSIPFNITEILTRYNADNLTLRELMLDLGHQREDMIVSCRWDGAQCGPEDFEPQFTDHGLCYVFNMRDSRPGKVIRNTGVKSGLRLLVNVENYEAMAGPHESAGLKFLLYDRRHLPLVFDLGLGMPTGYHAFLGLSLQVMTRLPPPYGNCSDSIKLEHGYPYTKMACKRQCFTDFFVKKCGCILPFMIANGVADCNMETVWLCGKEAESEFEAVADHICNCRPACNNFMYDPNLSYLTSAKADIYKLFQITNRTSLGIRYARARDTVTARNKDLLKENAGILNSLQARGVEVEKVLVEELPKAVQHCQDHLLEIEQNYTNVFAAINETYEFQLFVLFWRFYYPVLEKQRSYFSVPTHMYREFIADAHLKLDHLYQIGKEPDDEVERAIRTTLWKILGDRFRVRETLTKQAKTQLVEVVKNYTAAMPLDHIVYKDVFTDEQHTMIIPKSLLTKAVTDPKGKKRIDDAFKHLDGLAQSYSLMHQYGNAVFDKDNDKDYEADTFDSEIATKFMETVVAYDKNQGLLMRNVLRYPIVVVQDRIAECKKIQGEVEKDMEEMKNAVASIQEEMNATQLVFKGIFETVTGALANIQDEKRGKTKVSKTFTAVEFISKVNRIRRFFEDLKSKNTLIQTGYNHLDAKMMDIITLIDKNTDLKEYFKKFQTIFENKESITKAIGHEKLEEYKALDELSPVYGRNHSLFFDSMQYVQEDMKKYLDENKLDEKYYAANFIGMDLFFREMYYEKVSQEKAYTIISLLSDIGGSMGLYTGASILSICEIFDMLLFFCCSKRAARKAKDEEAAANAEKGGASGDEAKGKTDNKAGKKENKADKKENKTDKKEKTEKKESKPDKKESKMDKKESKMDKKESKIDKKESKVDKKEGKAGKKETKPGKKAKGNKIAIEDSADSTDNEIPDSLTPRKGPNQQDPFMDSALALVPRGNNPDWSPHKRPKDPATSRKHKQNRQKPKRPLDERQLVEGSSDTKPDDPLFPDLAASYFRADSKRRDGEPDGQPAPNSRPNSSSNRTPWPDKSLSPNLGQNVSLPSSSKSSKGKYPEFGSNYL